MTDSEGGRRRPQWRGERRAVLVRMPVEAADRLAGAARRTNRSMSDHAAELIVRGLDGLAD